MLLLQTRKSKRRTSDSILLSSICNIMDQRSSHRLAERLEAASKMEKYDNSILDVFIFCIKKEIDKCQQLTNVFFLEIKSSKVVARCLWNPSPLTRSRDGRESAASLSSPLLCRNWMSRRTVRKLCWSRCIGFWTVHGSFQCMLPSLILQSFPW